MPKHPKFEIRRDKKGEFRFNLSAANGQVVLSSEGYKTKASCKNGMASVLKNCANDACFERKVAKNGKHYFSLLARNKQIVGSSQMYAAKTSMENGIRSVRTNAPKAEVDDQS
jgi:uncharacterized protein YegP (UPF0339 family)